MLAGSMADPSFANLHLTREHAVATLTLDRPKQLNALDAAILREVARAVREIRRDGGVRALVVTGAGEKAFSAGADISAMAAMSGADGHAYSRLGHDVLARLSSSHPSARASGSRRSTSGSSRASAGRSGSSGASVRRGRASSSTSAT